MSAHGDRAAVPNSGSVLYLGPPPVSELLSAIVVGSPESHEHLLVNCIDLRLHFFWIGFAQKISSILQDMFTHTRDFHFFQSARHYLSVFAINVSIEIALTLG